MAFPARRRLASGGALAVLVSLTGYAARAGKASSRANRARGRQSALVEAAEKVHHLGVERFPGAYAGVEIRFLDCRLVVYRRVAPGFDQAVRRSVPDVTVTLSDARYTARELTDLAEWVRSERDMWKPRGISIIRAAPRHDGSAVDVAVPDAEVRRAGPILAARYGRAAVVAGCRTAVEVPRQVAWFSRVRGNLGIPRNGREVPP